MSIDMIARQIQYLKVENEILRARLPKRITVTSTEKRRSIRFAAKLGKAIHALATIVSPGTILRWIREDRHGKVPRKRGRKRNPIDVRRLVVNLASENAWGYTRILGELKMLGVRRISRNTVKRILKEHGLDTGPKRGMGTWDDFIRRHAISLWQSDFFTQRIVTLKGIRHAFVLVFIHIKTRQVMISPATMHPNEAWVVEQSEAFVKTARSCGLKVRTIQHDRDRKFSRRFVKAKMRKRVIARKNGYCSPKLNAFIERLIQSLRRECLDHFVVLGTKHLDHLSSEYAAH